MIGIQHLRGVKQRVWCDMLLLSLCAIFPFKFTRRSSVNALFDEISVVFTKALDMFAESSEALVVEHPLPVAKPPLTYFPNLEEGASEIPEEMEKTLREQVTFSFAWLYRNLYLQICKMIKTYSICCFYILYKTYLLMLETNL